MAKGVDKVYYSDKLSKEILDSHHTHFFSDMIWYDGVLDVILQSEKKNTKFFVTSIGHPLRMGIYDLAGEGEIKVKENEISMLTKGNETSYKHKITPFQGRSDFILEGRNGASHNFLCSAI